MKKVVVILFLFSLQINFLFSQKTKLINDINHFSFKIYDKIDKESDNVIFSGYSISNALSVIYAGAKDKTAVEFETVLQNKNKQDIHKYYKMLNDDLALNKELELLTANAIWLQKSYKYEKKYENLIVENYKAEINKANFSNHNGRREAINEINTWVNKKTKDNISDFIKPNMISESSVMVIINAIYFNSLWNKEFLVKKSKEGNFYTYRNDTVKAIFLNNSLSVDYFEDEKAKVIEIPYKNYEASLVLMLPHNNYSKFINDIDIDYYKNSIKKLRKVQVSISVPKFKYEADLYLSEILKKIGLELAFKSKANFSGITGEKNIHISKIIHKSVIELNEKGTEASSSTAIIATRSTSIKSKPKRFNANHPFVFFIKDNSTNLILFMGVMNQPSVKN